MELIKWFLKLQYNVAYTSFSFSIQLSNKFFIIKETILMKSVLFINLAQFRVYCKTKNPYLNLLTPVAQDLLFRLLVTKTNSTVSPGDSFSLSFTSDIWKKSFLPSSTS